MNRYRTSSTTRPAAAVLFAIVCTVGTNVAVADSRDGWARWNKKNPARPTSTARPTGRNVRFRTDGYHAKRGARALQKMLNGKLSNGKPTTIKSIRDDAARQKASNLRRSRLQSGRTTASTASRTRPVTRAPLGRTRTTSSTATRTRPVTRAPLGRTRTTASTATRTRPANPRSAGVAAANRRWNANYGRQSTARSTPRVNFGANQVRSFDKTRPANSVARPAGHTRTTASTATRTRPANPRSAGVAAANRRWNANYGRQGATRSAPRVNFGSNQVRSFNKARPANSVGRAAGRSLGSTVAGGARNTAKGAGRTFGKTVARNGPGIAKGTGRFGKGLLKGGVKGAIIQDVTGVDVIGIGIDAVKDPKAMPGKIKNAFKPKNIDKHIQKQSRNLHQNYLKFGHVSKGAKAIDKFTGGHIGRGARDFDRATGGHIGRGARTVSKGYNKVVDGAAKGVGTVYKGATRGASRAAKSVGKEAKKAAKSVKKGLKKLKFW